ncbi:MAG: PAS domain S-box protein [Bacteroidetes bacterium]|nr:MAG: PAS domain S-box protein [Bacteroidota bacterium]
MADAQHTDGTEPASDGAAVEPSVAGWEAIEAALGGGPLAPVRVDAAYRVCRWSPRAEQRFGWTAAELVGTVLTEGPLVAEADRGRLAEALAAWDPEAGGLRLRLRVRTRSGDERVTVWYGAAQRTPGGAVSSILLLVDDVTREAAEVEALRQAREEAEAMNRHKSAFLADLSHEIRTPLTSIIGFADVLLEELPERQREFAGMIATAARRLMGTLNSVLDMARLESRAPALRTDLFDLVALVREALALFQPQAAAKGLALSLEAPPEPVDVSLDPDAVHRVLANLLSNALKFTRQGEVRVRIRAEDDRVHLEVRDTGIGISEAFLPSLFEEFRQEPEARGEVGSGLGLSITRRLVQLMGGTIDVESRKGEGSTFTVRFPRRLDAGDAAAPGHA